MDLSDDSHLGSSINDIIRVKEKELHDIHNMRCTKLEKLVLERDNLLLESNKRYEKLKEDFQYNLSLLDARDDEINKLEDIVHKCRDQILAMEAEQKLLTGKLEAMIKIDNEKKIALEEEKSNNKVCTSNILNCIFLGNEVVAYA
jgi:hypothetical protein